MTRWQAQIRPETKIVAFGEEHGVKGVWAHQMELVKHWAQSGYKILVMLEHPVNVQDEIDSWLEQGFPSKPYLEKFLRPKTAGHLLGVYRMIETLAQLKGEGAALRTLCFDMVHEPAPRGIGKDEVKLFREILDTKDEDEFNLKRECYMISRVNENYANVEWADKVLIPCGSMHASKTRYILDDYAVSFEHIDTLTMWLSQREEVTSIYFYGMSGQSLYQAKGGGLELYPFDQATNILSCITGGPDTGYVRTVDLPECNDKNFWIEAYDYIFFQRVCEADEIVDRIVLPAN